MNKDLIKRIDEALEPPTDIGSAWVVLEDCRDEIQRLESELAKAKEYVPMTDDEITEATQVAKSDMLHQPTVYCWKTLETAIIARYNEQRGVK